MPVYEYECLECGLHFERLQHVDDRDAAQCPGGHRNVRRVFSPPAIVLEMLTTGKIPFAFCLPALDKTCPL